MDIHVEIAFHQQNRKTTEQEFWKNKCKDSVFYMEKAGPHDVRRYQPDIKEHGKKYQKYNYGTLFVILSGKCIGHHGRYKEA
jgi:uncharacterized protein CbrC (UPF0167 family)